MFKIGFVFTFEAKH